MKETASLDPFFRMYASKKTRANILSLAEVEDRLLVTVPQESFTVHHLTEVDVVFYHRDGMHVADWVQYRHICATESTPIYTKTEEACGPQAYEFLCTSRFPSVGEVIHLLHDGNIIGLPSLTTEDLRRAYDLYGTPLEYICGKMT